MGTCIQTKQNVKDQDLQCQQFQFTLYQRQQDKLKPQTSLEPKEITIYHIFRTIEFPLLLLHQFEENLENDIYSDSDSTFENYKKQIENVQNSKQFSKNKISNKKQIKQAIKDLRKQFSLQALTNYILPLIYFEHHKSEITMTCPIISRVSKDNDDSFIKQVVDYNGSLLINQVQSQITYIAIFCLLMNNKPIKLINNLTNFDLVKYPQFTENNMILYKISADDNQNEHLPKQFRGDFICELLIESNKNRLNLQQLKNDFADGLYLLSYKSLKEHMKRRCMKQYHLWLCLSFDDYINKTLIACSIFVNYLKKQLQPDQIESEISRIIQGGTLYYTFDRLKCLIDGIDLSEKEIDYLLSDTIVKNAIQMALSNAKTLISCLEQKFNIKVKTRVKQIGNIDSHYFTSSAYLKYNSIVEEYCVKTELLFSEREIAYQWIQSNQTEGSYELFLPSLFYNNPKQKYFVPNIEILNQWILKLTDFETEVFLQEARLLIEIQDPNQMCESQYYKVVQYQLFDYVLKGYYYENQFVTSLESQRFYESAIKLCRQCFGDYRNRGSILYPLEAFCWHRLSVYASQRGDADQLNIIQHFFSQFVNIALPCNNISSHQYLNRELNQVLRASLKGFALHDWLFRRFNELLDENIETSDPQFIYQPGQIIMWGFNQNYQLGQSYQLKYNIPISVKSHIMFTKITCGYKHTLAICNQRRVYCWGNNEDGKCGKPLIQKYLSSPALIESSQNCVSIECGHDHSVYINTNEEVYAWGCGEGGLLGNGKMESTYLPQLVLIPGRCSSMKCGGLHNAAIVENKLYVWGRGDGGQLGLPLELGFEISLPTKVELENVIQVACGDAHTIALNNKGEAYGWGYNEQGQLGLNIDAVSVIIPTLICQNVTQIYGGSLQSYFVREGVLYGCGCNDDGQLGVDITTKEYGIRQIFNSNVNQLSIGQDHTLCNSQYKVYGWGMNKYGELCMQNTTMPKELFNYKVQSLGCGAYHSGVVMAGTDKYTAYQNDYDYKILFIE